MGVPPFLFSRSHLRESCVADSIIKNNRPEEHILFREKPICNFVFIVYFPHTKAREDVCFSSKFYTLFVHFSLFSCAREVKKVQWCYQNGMKAAAKNNAAQQTERKKPYG